MSEQVKASFYKLTKPGKEAILELIQIQMDDEDTIIEQYHSQEGFLYMSELEVSKLEPGYKPLDDKTYEKLIEDEAWEKLCKGLSKGNVKTLDWLQQRAVILA